jgi:hypothetical protein
MAKHFLAVKDNIIEKKLLVMTKDKSFYASNELVTLKNNIFEFYGSMFLNGDTAQARKLIDSNSGA